MKILNLLIVVAFLIAGYASSILPVMIATLVVIGVAAAIIVGIKSIVGRIKLAFI